MEAKKTLPPHSRALLSIARAMGFAGAGWANENDTEDAVNPVQGGKLAELPVGNVLLKAGLKGFKGFKGFDRRNLCLLDAALFYPLFSAGDFIFEVTDEGIFIGNGLGRQGKGVVGQIGEAQLFGQGMELVKLFHLDAPPSMGEA